MKALLALLFLIASAHAQVIAVAPVIPPLHINGGVQLGAFKMPAVKGEPFSLTSKTTNTKKLTDGTWTTTVLEERRMRDSEGRERSEFVDPSGRAISARLTDPVAQTIVYLQLWDKTARVTHIPLPKPPTPEEEARAAESRARIAEFVANHPPLPIEAKDELTPRTIEGVYAEGKRQTFVLDAKLSNGEPVRVVEDTWTAPDLKIPLASTSDDPRGQKITMTVTGLQRAEPDPALFQIPADYKMVEQEN
jgi:hypothetical protein